MKGIVLASKSPRRKEILELLGINFEVVVSKADETFNNALSVYKNLENIAFNKAYAVLKNHEKNIVIGADTIVYLDGNILTKPKDRNDARNMFNMLNGRTHSVISGLAILSKDKMVKTTTETKVSFKKISSEEIEEYINTTEPYDKAGGYAIQGLASKYIDRIDGDYFNVVGLSISTVYDILKEFR